LLFCADAAERLRNWRYIRAVGAVRPQIALKNFSGFSQGDSTMIQQEIYEFGPYSLDSVQMLFRRDGSVVQLQPRALETLLVLVRRNGGVVSKQELMEAVWPDSFVEEGNLTQNIFLLRRELGKTVKGEDYIQTVPKRGYRMNVPVVNRTAQTVSRIDVAPKNLEPEPDAESTTEAAGRTGNQSWLAASGPVLAILVILVLALAAVVLWRSESVQPRALGYVQITHDGAIKRGYASQLGGPDAALFTDGTRLYFMEGSSDAPVIAQVSASGGETGQVAVPFELPELVDVSRMRSELLVGGLVNPAAESPLWIVPVPAGSAHRLQDISAWDASWSPDGRELVYVKGMELYGANSDGTDVRHLVTLPGQGWEPRWSPDGQRLRLTVLDVKTSIHSLWELSRDGTGLRPLKWSGGNGPEVRMADAPLDVCCGSWSPDGRDFVFQETRGGRSEIWSMPGKPSLLGRLFPSLEAPVQVSNGQLSSRAPVFSPDGSKLFVIGQQLRGELERFDRRTAQFVPYLGGISADFVDFSRDGKWVAYVAYPEGTLWRSRIDGSERLQLTVAPMEVTVPRWSPDGSQIAFYVIGGAKQQRLYLIGADGGKPKAASSLDGGEMSAHWSPDGASVLYSDFPFFSATPAKVAVHRLDLKTQKIETLPGSEGYFAPTWSPDGRYATAKALGGQRIMIFDFKTNEWSELTKGAGLQKWSRDGNYLYYLRYGPDSAVMRVRIRDREVEEVAGLRGIRQAGRLAGLDFGLTPDGDPLVLRDVGTQEIYSLDWARR
jgi:DNA-binding winged helix-turn-helix (wHTH) protein/Tol biopolymer transport system component